MFNLLNLVEEIQQEQPSEKPKAKAKSEEKETREKPANTKLDINKLRSVVQRNILDNDRRQQKAEARKTESSRLEGEAEKSEVVAGELDNMKAEKSDNYQHVEAETGPSEKKKKKKKRRQERAECLAAQRTLNCDSKSDEFDSSSKPNAGNRFSRVAGPREKPRWQLLQK